MSGNSTSNDEKLKSFLDTKQVDSDAIDEIEDAAKKDRPPRSMTAELQERRARFRSRCRWSAVGILCVLLLSAVAHRIHVHYRVMSEIEKLKDPDATIRAKAAKTLRDFGPAAKAAVPALVEAANEEVGWATNALESIGASGKWALPQLIERLTDEDPRGRAMAAFAIGCIGPKAKEAVPHLIESLQDPATRLVAAQALGKIGPSAKAAVPALVEATKDEQDGSPFHVAEGRARAAEAIWLIDRDPRAVQVLIDVLEGDDQMGLMSHYTAASALASMGPSAKEAVPALIEASVRNPGNGNIPVALERIGVDVRAVPSLIQALVHPNMTDYRREQFTTLLKKIGPPAVPQLIEATKSQDTRQRQAAYDALRRIDPGAAAKLDVKRPASEK